MAASNFPSWSSREFFGFEIVWFARFLNKNCFRYFLFYVGVAPVVEEGQLFR